jgi:membrane fusion protein (multidrug efflux system)
MKNEQLSKRMRIMLISLGILFGLIILYKIFISIMISRFIASNKSPLITVSDMKATYSTWQPKVDASASLRAIQGVNVTTSLAGIVQKIYFVPGSVVKQGTLLVQINADSEKAQLASLQASEKLAEITLKRDKSQFAIKAVSQAVLDSDVANLKNFQAQVAQQQAIIDKKTIVAPFNGRLGISAVNPGQYVNDGDKIVSLQQLNPLYADFYVPQTAIVKLKVGQTVRVLSDAYPKEIFAGKITTIDPIVDSTTRNVQVEATIDNQQLKLLPGMFALASVDTGAPKQYITLPQTAVTFNPYGDVIYKVIEQKDDAKKNDNKHSLTVKQSFVTTGEVRGDQVVILKGVEAGDRVVTSGQLKLKNDSRVTIDNSVVPANNPAPTPADD